MHTAAWKNEVIQQVAFPIWLSERSKIAKGQCNKPLNNAMWNDSKSIIIGFLNKICSHHLAYVCVHVCMCSCVYVYMCVCVCVCVCLSMVEDRKQFLMSLLDTVYYVLFYNYQWVYVCVHVCVVGARLYTCHWNMYLVQRTNFRSQFSPSWDGTQAIRPVSQGFYLRSHPTSPTTLGKHSTCWATSLASIVCDHVKILNILGSQCPYP